MKIKRYLSIIIFISIPFILMFVLTRPISSKVYKYQGVLISISYEGVPFINEFTILHFNNNVQFKLNGHHEYLLGKIYEVIYEKADFLEITKVLEINLVN